jgi:DUF2997 family protein
MAEETIEITIAPDGKAEIRVNGIAGMDCLSETEDLVGLLGGDIESQELTSQAFEGVGEEQQERQWH